MEYKRIGSKKDQDPAEQTLNPIDPCPASKHRVGRCMFPKARAVIPHGLVYYSSCDLPLGLQLATYGFSLYNNKNL